MRFFEEIKVGEVRTIGTFLFTTESIKDFAQRFDPQPFSLSVTEARGRGYAGLVASGWHVSSVSMKLYVGDAMRQIKQMAMRGEDAPVWGPSPGFRELRWIKPVLSGDTVSFAYVIGAKRLSKSRKGWGIVDIHLSGMNQRAEPVYSILSTAFVPRRSALHSMLAIDTPTLAPIEISIPSTK